MIEAGTWKYVKLGEVCKTTSGGTPNRGNSAYYGGDIPWVKSGELDKGLITDTEEKITDDALKNCSAKMFPKGTLLIALYGATIGKLAFLGIEAATNQAICGIFESDKINSKFLYNFLLYKKPSLVKQSFGGAQPNISQAILRNLELPLPPKETQAAVVSKLEELFSELDNGIENLRTAQQQLKTYRQSVLKWAFEGKLTGKKFKEGELPAGWKWVKMGDVCNKIGDIDHKMPKQLTSGYPYVSTKDFTDDLRISFENAKYISEEDYLNLSRKIKPERGDIIFPRYGTIGKNILVDFDKQFLVSYSCAVVKPMHNVVLSKYVYLYSLSPKITDEIRKYVVETTQANIGIASIKSFVFPLCSIKEQQAVVDAIESRLSITDKLEETISQSLQQAEAVRQSILKKAFEGKLISEPIVKETPTFKPKNPYFYQIQMLGYVLKVSKEKQVNHGEMTAAKYVYLLDRLYGVPSLYKFKRLHLGPYPVEMKKVINNKTYFKLADNTLEVLAADKLFKYNNPYQTQIESAVTDLANIFSKYPAKERSRQTELLATVCKVIEDIQTMDLAAVRVSMKDWLINLKTTSFKNKAEKFTETETEKCLAFIVKQGWDKKLMN